MNRSCQHLTTILYASPIYFLNHGVKKFVSSYSLTPLLNLLVNCTQLSVILLLNLLWLLSWLTSSEVRVCSARQSLLAGGLPTMDQHCELHSSLGQFCIFFMQTSKSFTPMCRLYEGLWLLEAQVTVWFTWHLWIITAHVCSMSSKIPQIHTSDSETHCL